ncbi:MAG: hypothetical protein KTV77_03120 [Wolbachia endosymbiont of Fragariocoptes setiger]|nr:hypothetical protein [Wolbachia endosymbiont of Fragariocoptes setiger]
MPSTLKAKAFAEIVGNLSTKKYSSKQHLKGENIQQQELEVNSTKLENIRPLSKLKKAKN